MRRQCRCSQYGHCYLEPKHTNYQWFYPSSTLPVKAKHHLVQLFLRVINFDTNTLLKQAVYLNMRKCYIRFANPETPFENSTPLHKILGRLCAVIIKAIYKKQQTITSCKHVRLIKTPRTPILYRKTGVERDPLINSFEPQH